jgi:hypothetical protein
MLPNNMMGHQLLMREWSPFFGMKTISLLFKSGGISPASRMRLKALKRAGVMN